MSLANRVALLAVAVLVVSGAVMGVAYYGSVRRSLEASHKSALDARIAWLKAVLAVNVNDGKIDLNARGDELGTDVSWQIAASDENVLWASVKGSVPDDGVRIELLEFGDADAPLVKAKDIRPDDRELRGPVDKDDIPRKVRSAIDAALPDFVATDIDRDRENSRSEYIYKVIGIAASREHVFEVSQSGSIKRHRKRGFVDFEMPEGDHRLQLQMTVWAPRGHIARELDRLATVIWTVGPLALALAGALLWLVVRHQLRPLGRMAEEAAAIGPGNVDGRIGPVGTGIECVRLRDATNSMIERLAEGLARERRFASTAAHELRGPLAQLRTTVEVALRKERDKSEYQEALTDALSDAERLQRLIEGLLQLARTTDSAVPDGRPVSLGSTIERIVKEGHALTRPDDPPSTDRTVKGEAELLYRSVCNVIENAERYAPGAPPSIRTLGKDDGVQLIVSDTGPGVPETDRERIFEPLTRLDEARSIEGASDGFGLGLAVARSTVRAFGGDLVCQARADGKDGAEFVFTFLSAQV